MSLPPRSGWSVPPPPAPPERPIRAAKVFAGIGLAFLGQIPAIGLGVLAVYAGGVNGIYVEVVLQVLLFVACLVLGVVWIARRDRGTGLGLLIGWAVTVLVFPVAGIGVCIAVLNSQGTT